MYEVAAQSRAIADRVFLLSRALALFPLSLRKSNFTLDPLLTTAAVVAKVLLGVHTLLIHDSAQFINSVVAFCLIVFYGLMVFFRRNTFDSLFRQLSDCHFLFLQLGKSPPIKTDMKLDCLLVFLSFSTTIIDAKLVQGLNLFTFCKIWLNLCILGTVHPFIHLVRTLQHWFVCLHQMLQNPSRRRTLHLQRLCDLHLRCASACYTLNACFTQQLLWTLCSVFLNLISTSYDVFVVVEKDSGLLRITNKVLCLLYFMAICFLVSSVCADASREARQFNTLLYHSMVADTEATDEKLSLHISMHQEVVFTASNFFILDYTLVHSMISAATTYLVCLIQLEEPDTQSTSVPSINSSSAVRRT